jgi:hypothetical protein
MQHTVQSPLQREVNLSSSEINGKGRGTKKEDPMGNGS